jgi:hypothetical protein
MPLGVVTVTSTRPGGSAGDTVVIDVAEFNVKLAALVAPNLTAVAPVKLVPVTVTEVPPAAGPFLGDSFLIVGGMVEPTLTRPDIALPCTKQKYLNVPAFAKVHVPFQLVSPLLTGTPLHAGVPGFPASQTTPCGTEALVFWKLTVPPGGTVTSGGTHMSDSVPLTVGLDSATAGTTTTAAPSTPANSRQRLRVLTIDLPAEDVLKDAHAPVSRIDVPEGPAPPPPCSAMRQRRASVEASSGASGVI